MGIERQLRAVFGEALLEVVQVDKIDTHTATFENIDRHLDMLRGAVRGMGGAVEVVSVEGTAVTLRYKGPRPIGQGLAAAVKDQFPTIKEVVVVDW